jgi:aspartate/methionine/tyrosine aminotransferase
MSRPPSAFKASPFAQLAELIAGLTPAMAPIDLSVGEPRHGVPAFVGPALQAALAGFGRYPATRGTDEFHAAAAAWLDRRFGLGGRLDPDRGVIVLNGSREGLFSAALEARRRFPEKTAPAILLPNPFYAVYAAGAEVAGAEAVAVSGDGDLPDLDKLAPEVLQRTIAVYYASPTNPQGAVASLERWQSVIRLARRHGFMIFADECYSEIHRGTPPAGALEAAVAMGGGFERVVAFNSLSKRSNLPGLRVGFAAGDPDFIAGWGAARNVYSPQVPGPAQAVAISAFADEVHVAENRRLYDEKFAAAERILAGRFGYRTPAGGFFLWLDVGPAGGADAARRLWAEAGVKVVPGAFLSVPDADGLNPGGRYIRIAMVETLERTEEALTRLVGVLA